MADPENRKEYHLRINIACFSQGVHCFKQSFSHITLSGCGREVNAKH